MVHGGVGLGQARDTCTREKVAFGGRAGDDLAKEKATHLDKLERNGPGPLGRGILYISTLREFT